MLIPKPDEKKIVKSHVDGLVQDCGISSLSNGDTTVLHWAIKMNII